MLEMVTVRASWCREAVSGGVPPVEEKIMKEL